jgi:hypothetical protein
MFQKKNDCMSGESVAVYRFAKFTNKYVHVSFSSLFFHYFIWYIDRSFHKKLSQFEKKLMPFIANIDMDHFECTTGRIATKKIRPCICFIVILDDGKGVFVEHRSDIYLPP